jgi:hypothetical protein
VSIAPISPVEEPEAATSPPASVPRGREVLFALLVAVVVAGLGAPFGWLWSKLAPHVELVQTQYGPYPIQPEPEGYWADDGWFILMALGMGAIVAVAAWFLLRRYRGPILLAAIVLGSIGASVLAAWLGNKIGWSHYIDQAEHAPVDTHIFRPVKLRTGSASLAFGVLPWVRGTLLLQGLAAAAVYTGLAGFHASPTLRYDNMPPEYLNAPAPGAYPPPPGAVYPSDPAAGYPQPSPAAYDPAQPGFAPQPSGYDQGQAGLPPASAGYPAADAPEATHEHPQGSDGHAQQQFGFPPSPNGAQPAAAGHTVTDQGWSVPAPTAPGGAPTAPHADIVWPPDGPIPGPHSDADGSSEPRPER